MNKCSNFGDDPDHRLDTEIVFRNRHYWEIRKVVDGHESAAHTDLPDGGISKTCLGGGMHCPGGSSSSLQLQSQRRADGNQRNVCRTGATS